MAWYLGANDRKIRLSVAVQDDGGGTSPYIVQVAFGPSDVRFWDNVQSDGYDVIFTLGDGTQALNAHRATWNYAAKSAIFRISTVNLSSDATRDRVHQLFVYVDSTNAIVADPSIPDPGAAALTGRVSERRPAPSQIAWIAPEPGSTEPALAIQVEPDEDKRELWLDFGAILLPGERYNGKRLFDELAFVEIATFQSGTIGTNRVLYGLTRIVDGRFCNIVMSFASAGDYVVMVRFAVCNPKNGLEVFSSPENTIPRIETLKVKVTVYELTE